MFLKDAALEYLATLKRLQPRTRSLYEQRLTTFLEWCGAEFPLESIRARTVENFVEHIYNTHAPHKSSKQKVSSYTLAGYVRIIKAFLNWCVEDEEFGEYVKPVVVTRIKLPKQEEDIISPYTEAEFGRLLHAAKQEESEHLQLRGRAVLWLLWDTGIRANELVTLSLDHVSLEPKESYIKVFGKGRKWREVPMGDMARRALRTYIRTYRSEAGRGDVVFLSRSKKDPSPLTVSGLEQSLERMGKRAGVEECRPHRFRHTFAVRYMQAHSDIYRLSRYLGHASVGVTEEYLRAFPDRT